MTDPFSLGISVLALALSSATAWLTLFRKGHLRMTQPTVIFFGPDSAEGDSPLPKIYLRTLLFSTSKCGHIIQSMHVTVSHNEVHQNFNIWVLGEDKLARGSGLFVSETGVLANHHFIAPPQAGGFTFTEGKYKLEVFVATLGDRAPQMIFSQELEVSHENAALLAEPDAGLYFDWGPDSGHYLQHVAKKAISL